MEKSTEQRILGKLEQLEGAGRAAGRKGVLSHTVSRYLSSPVQQLQIIFPLLEIGEEGKIYVKATNQKGEKEKALQDLSLHLYSGGEKLG